LIDDGLEKAGLERYSQLGTICLSNCTGKWCKSGGFQRNQPDYYAGHRPASLYPLSDVITCSPPSGGTFGFLRDTPSGGGGAVSIWWLLRRTGPGVLAAAAAVLTRGMSGGRHH